ncbi:MAG: putative mannose-6-phosphate isomerase YvyI [Candidatus Izimaplasma bacterium HR2]|nr:MAG: putative mannose-6-phosphate isomerase YvyI [Candidatus Izimaplasma bacterium HR2]
MILKLQPVFYDKIWGGNKLRKNYGFDVSNTCGECWGITAHKKGSSIIENSIYKGMTLRDIFFNEKHLFGDYKGNEFPILVKIIDAKQDLSIQVHPNDEFVKGENILGKEECWYILHTEKNTKIIIGHSANNIKEVKEAINNNNIESICNTRKIEEDDFFYIESGTIHAICEGTTLLEVQQSSDITYRFFDYNRLENGKPRKLHIEKAIKALKIPDKKMLVEHKDTFFNFQIKYNIGTMNKIASLFGDYIFIIDGEGYFNNTRVIKGNFIMVTSQSQYIIEGNIKYQLTTF